MKRALYAGGAAGLLAGSYLLGSVTLGGALAQTPTQTQQPAASVPAQTQTGSQDAADGPDTGSPDQAGQSETPEAQALAGKATITADHAKAAALVRFPGATVQTVGLESENGTVVYGVQLTDSTGKAQDVKVDAGTGQVLQVDAGGADTPGTAGQETAGAED